MPLLHRQRSRAAPSSLGASLREMLHFYFWSCLRISACLFWRIKLAHELGTCITFFKICAVVLELRNSELETELAYILVCAFGFFPSILIPLQWVVSPADKIKYDEIFVKTDKDMDGFVSGVEARELFLKTGLPSALLAHIW